MNGKLTGKALVAQIIARGNDGISPVVSVEGIEGGHRITIKDLSGTHTVDVMDGAGLCVLGSYDSAAELELAHPTGNTGDGYIVGGDLYVWDATTQKWLNIGNVKGEPGEQGEPGKDGRTPEKGVDYFTEDDKQEIAAAAAELATPTDYLKKTGDTMTGALVAHSDTEYTTGQVRNIFLVAEGEDLPSGSNGDICLVYTP